MATQHLPILHAGWLPDNANVTWVRAQDFMTNDVWKFGLWKFANTSTRDGLHGTFRVPKNFVGSAVILAEWTSSVTSGLVRWEVDYRAIGGNDTESLDQAGTQEAISLGTNDSAPGAAWRKMQISGNLTSSNLAVDDTVEIAIFRDGSDASNDTLAGDIFLVDLIFEYADA